MDERYTNSLIDSEKAYLFNLQYLGNNDKITLRALGTFKILHQLYSWADWFEVCEDKKIKIEQLMNCIIMRNSNLILPTIIPGPFYSNVSTPQTIYTWQKVYDMPNVQVHEDLDPVERVSHYLAIQASNSGVNVPITVSREDISGQLNGTTAFLRTYFDGDAITLTAPATLSNSNTFSHWVLDGVSQANGVLSLTATMLSNKVAIAVYNTYVPGAGSLTIYKTVTTHTGVEVDSSALFEVSITDGNTIRSGFVRNDTPLIFNNLPLGTYTVSEEVSPTHDITSILPNPVTLTTELPNRSVTIINAQKAPIGVITINKIILVDGLQDLEDTTSFEVEITNGTNTFTGNVSQATPLVFTEVPLGAYTVTETVPQFYQWVSVFKPVITITNETPTGEITIVNSHTPVVGSITFSKVVKDQFGVEDPADTTVFTVNATDLSNTIWSGEVSIGNPLIIDNLPPGTYTITESAKDGYQIDSIIATPVVIVEGDLLHNVVITNSQLPPPAIGSITINKRVEGITDVIEYGALYNWYAITDVRNLANDEWHVSTEQDWADLQAFVIETYPLIETGSSHWAPVISSATNATGFTARPSGYRAATGTYGGLGTTAQYWTSREASASEGSMFFISNSPLFGYVFLDKRYGGAVRIVKDSTTLTNGQIGTYIGNDGKVYKTICIGTKEWVIENLFETKFRNLDLIDYVSSGTWTSLATAAFCYPNGDINNTTAKGIGLVDDETLFSTSITDGVTPISQDVTYNMPAIFPALGFDTYAITEVQQPGYEAPIIANQTLTLTEVNPNQFTTITNRQISEVGSITINKIILNSSSENVTVFEFIATGSGVNPLTYNASGTIAVPAIFSDLPLDTYTITEVPNINYPIVSITPNVCTLTTLDPDQTVEAVNGNLNPEYGYGLLYNWWAANDAQFIANDGWELPSVGDFTNLGTNLGGNFIAGGKMKLPGYTYWKSPNTGATNTSGFNAVGAGGRSSETGAFEQELFYTSYWTTNEFDADKSSLVALSFNSSTLIIDQYPPDKFGLSKNTGVSIRLRKIKTDLDEGKTGLYIGNDGHIYHTICIGGVEWLSENLQETRFRNGVLIPNVSDGATWMVTRNAARCAYNNDPNNV